MNHNQVTISGRVADKCLYKYNRNGESYTVCLLESEYFCYNKIKRPKVKISVPDKLASQTKISEGVYIQIEGSLINNHHNWQTDIAVLAHKISYSTPWEMAVDSVTLSGIVRKVITDESNFSSFVNFILSIKDTDALSRDITVRVIVWGKLAYSLYGTLYEGDHITVTGSLNTMENAYGILSSEVYCTSVEMGERDDIMTEELFASLCEGDPLASSY